MKIFAGGIATETNTFSPLITTIDDFEVKRGRDSGIGEETTSSLDLSKVWGSLAESAGHEFVFALMAFAQPGGLTTRNAYETLRDELLDELRAAMPVDIVLLNLHGAMVAQGYVDCEEDLLSRARALVGPDTVIAVEFDLHCHLSEAKIAPADIVVTYKEYPHLDVYERAHEVFSLAIAAKTGAIRPRTALFDCQMVGMFPTSREPMRSFVEALQEAERRPGILSASFGHGFQFADVPHVGAKVLVIADADEQLARDVAEELGRRIYELRAEIGFATISLPLEDALARALEAPRKPAVVADQSDNVGGGAPGDSTCALQWLLQHNVKPAAIGILYDPEVVRLCFKAGVGAQLPLRLGGKLGPASGAPLDIEAEIMGLRSNYIHPLLQRGGEPWWFPAGDVAALRCNGVSIIVSTRRCQCMHPSVFTDFGIDPSTQCVLVVKSYQHFHDAFAPIAGCIIYMAAPGAVPPLPHLIPYKHVRTSRLYPWVEDPLEHAPWRTSS